MVAGVLLCPKIISKDWIGVSSIVLAIN